MATTENGPERGRYEIWPLEKLVPYDKNAKKHGPDQVARIAKSIEQFGWTTRIVVDKNGVIIAGHGRRLAAQKLGLARVPVHIRDDLPEKEVRALRLADNKVAESEIDTSLLELELKDLYEDAFDMSGFFSEKELSFLLEDPGEIDLGAISGDITAEVNQHTAETDGKIQETDDEMTPVTSILGITKVNGDQRRRLSLFLIHAETVTRKKGIEALLDFGDQILESVE